MDFNIIIGAIFILALTAVYLFVKNRYSYWKKMGVPYIEPSMIYGNLEGVGTKIHFGQFMKDIYDKYKNETPIFGLYTLLSPIVLIWDLDLIKNIMIKDFNNFTDRGVYSNEKDDPLSAHMFNLEGKKWKAIRSKLTPTFTSGKMKFMFSTIIEIAERFENKMMDLVKMEVDIEIKDLMARFTTDVIGTCAFGIECNCLDDPNVQFRIESQKVFDSPRHNEVIRQFTQSYPKLSNALKIKNERDDVAEFFMKIVRDTIDYREKNKIRRNDFMDLLIQMKKDGGLDGNKITELGAITFEQIASECYLFFLAGFETSATTVSFCLHELALNPDIQNKAREEIFSVLKQHDNKLTYEAIKEMSYLEQILNETLRFYPPVPVLNRKARDDYPIPETKWILEKNMKINIPIYAIHHDLNIYPDPEKFDPERFSPEEIKNRHPCAFLAFGEGPRNCIGARFGKLQVLTALIIVLRKFELSACSLTTEHIKISTKSLILASESGIWLHVKKLDYGY